MTLGLDGRELILASYQRFRPKGEPMMDPVPSSDSVLIAVPAYGAPHLTDGVLGDLLHDSARLLPKSRIVVIDNDGSYLPQTVEDRLSVYRPGTNLRWLGSVNWALNSAAEQGDSVCIVLNNDTRLSPDFAYWLTLSFTDCAGAGVAAACYDDFWIHQRAHVIPAEARDFVGSHSSRSEQPTSLAGSIRWHSPSRDTAPTSTTRCGHAQKECGAS
jgi:hypothetical protein